MKTKLNKLFLFSSDVYKRQFTRAHLLFFVAPVALLFIMNELRWWLALFFFAINVVLFFLIRREYPSYIEIDDGCVLFNEYNNLGNTNGVRVVITMSNIKRIEFSQSSFEKLFNMGQIKVSGEPSVKVVNGKLGLKEYPTSKSYTFYGVKNYSATKEYFSKSFSKSIQKEL